MAKVKFTLQPAPTFKAIVKIPVPGAGFTPVEFTFKYRDRAAFEAFVGGLTDDMAPLDVLQDIASGWALDEPFDAANLQMMMNNYMGSFRAVLDAYIAEMTKAVPRVGN